VLLYDLYGRGYSDAPYSVPYDTGLYVTQLALLLQHVGWPKARVVGVSMGGAIGAALVAAFPGLVEREVVLIASAGLIEVRLKACYFGGLDVEQSAPQSADLPRTAKFMSSPLVQTLTANPLVYVRLSLLSVCLDPV
jgi:pimeloyl-ACP methyl ester carboxylesterase